jgi:hypothetical protein
MSNIDDNIYRYGGDEAIMVRNEIWGTKQAADELNRLTRDLTAANATVEKCKAAGFIDERGEVRKVAHGLPLPITADGVIAIYGESYWYWDRVNNYHDPIKYGWTERQLESCKPSEDAEYSFTTDPSLCYSTKEAALGAKA